MATGGENVETELSVRPKETRQTAEKKDPKIEKQTGDTSLQIGDDVSKEFDLIASFAERLKLSKAQAMEFVQRELDRRHETQRHIDTLSMAKTREIERLNKELDREKEKRSKADEEFRMKTKETPQKNFLSNLKLPMFDEKSTDIEAFIFRFEKHAEICNWSKDLWCQALASRLSGESLEVFRDLSIDKATTFEKLKEALYKHFKVTEDGFKEKFRESKPKSGENFAIFTDRLQRNFARWLDTAKVKDFEALKDLILREHVYVVCSKELVTFLKQEGCTSMDDVTTKAERFRLANPSKPLCTKSVSSESVFHTGFADTSGRMKNGKGQNFNRGKGRGGHYNSQERQNSQDSQASKSSQVSNSSATIPSDVDKDTCRACGQKGHWAKGCRNRKKFAQRRNENQSNDGNDAKVCIENKKNESEPNLVMDGQEKCERVSAATGYNNVLTTCEGRCNGEKVDILLDTGCSTIGVHKRFVKRNQMTGEIKNCIGFGGESLCYPVAKVHIESPYFTGEVKACVLECPSYDVILGKFNGCSLRVSGEEQHVNAVMTRRQKKEEERPTKPLRVRQTPLLVSHDELIKLQKEDSSLNDEREKAQSGEKYLKRNGVITFEYEDDVLVRSYTAKSTGEVTTQIVVPKTLRDTVMSIAHDSIMAGHMASGSTKKRLMQNFYWKGFSKDIIKYCRSCDKCQKVAPKGRIKQAPLQEMPTIDVPFDRVGIDIVGPFVCSDRKHRYVLTCVDFATRYPEAIPLQRIDTESVAEALISIFARVGLPREVLADNGTQLSSEMMKEVMRLLTIGQIHTTIYHAQTNGLVERFHSTLKSMLRKMSEEQPKDWDRYIPALLFAYREIPQSSTGYSPFELLYGRTPRGPLALLKETWIEKKQGKPISEYQFVLDLRDRIEKTCKIAQENVKNAAGRYKIIKDKKAELRTLQQGDEVLVLLPTDTNKLLLKWQGPFTVMKKCNNVDYVVKTSRGEKVMHINMLKKYHRRIDDTPDIAAVSIIAEEHAEDDEDVFKVKLQTFPLPAKEDYHDVKYGKDLTAKQTQEIKTVLQDFKDVLTDNPGKTSAIQHEIKLTSDAPIQKRQYPVPFASLETVEKEVDYMLNMGVIERSTSAYSHPFVLVKKKCGQTRFCIDFRGLNKITVLDAEPIPDFEEMLTKLQGRKYFTQIDLAKGYWQIEVKEEDRHLTAFRTSKGLFHFVRMPFGLVSAPHSFARLMKLLKLEDFNAVHYFDNVLIATEDWDQHVRDVRSVFQRLREFGLTARPSKVEAGFEELEFLGHFLSKGKIKPTQEKVDKILKLETPTTKKQVRSICGLISFYRRYIPHLSGILSPLTEHTKKNQPTKVNWNEDSQKALETVQDILSDEPVLIIPDISKPFTLRTDASNVGLGAVLLQESPKEPNEYHPVAYASRKLLDREKNYAIVERECLAVVWGIDKFTRYLFGKNFNLETDHSSLRYLHDTRLKNSRLMRWALALQEYQFNIVPISGTSNVEADALSRCPQG